LISETQLGEICGCRPMRGIVPVPRRLAFANSGAFSSNSNVAACRREWRLLFDSAVHGSSLETLYARCNADDGALAGLNGGGAYNGFASGASGLVSKVRSRSATLIIIRDTKGAVFGGFLADGQLAPNTDSGTPAGSAGGHAAYSRTGNGNASSFVFTFQPPGPKRTGCPATCSDGPFAAFAAQKPEQPGGAVSQGEYAYAVCRHSFIAMGGSGSVRASGSARSSGRESVFNISTSPAAGAKANRATGASKAGAISNKATSAFAWSLDEDLSQGMSGRSDAFNNEPLSGTGGGSGATRNFKCVAVEVWGTS
jgi:hypothetical protein